MQEYHYRRFSQSSEIPGGAKVDLQATKLNNSKKVVCVRTENEKDVKKWKTNVIIHPLILEVISSGKIQTYIIGGVTPQGIFKTDLLPNAKRLKGTGNVSIGVVVFKEKRWTWLGDSTFSPNGFLPVPVLPQGWGDLMRIFVKLFSLDFQLKKQKNKNCFFWNFFSYNKQK